MVETLGQVTLFTTWTLIFITAALALIFTILFFVLAFDAEKLPIVAGREALIDAEGTVITVQDTMMVRIFGEIWEAKSAHRLHPGDAIKVIGIKGLLLIVEPIKA